MSLYEMEEKNIGNWKITLKAGYQFIGAYYGNRDKKEPRSSEPQAHIEISYLKNNNLDFKNIPGIGELRIDLAEPIKENFYLGDYESTHYNVYYIDQERMSKLYKIIAAYLVLDKKGFLKLDPAEKIVKKEIENLIGGGDGYLSDEKLNRVNDDIMTSGCVSEEQIKEQFEIGQMIADQKKERALAAEEAKRIAILKDKRIKELNEQIAISKANAKERAKEAKLVRKQMLEKIRLQNRQMSVTDRLKFNFAKLFTHSANKISKNNNELGL